MRPFQLDQGERAGTGGRGRYVGQVALTVVLGAGFSKAVYDDFPTVDDLGERVREAAPDAFLSAPPKFRNGYFERWLSRLAEAQPDLSEAENLANARDFQIVTETIHRVLVELEECAVEKPAPWWLLRFVGVLHQLRATVITFNYDTLIERAARLIPTPDGAVNGFSLTDGIPPTPVRAGMMVGPNVVETFRLLKLHGSVDAYWVPGDRSGVTITRVVDSMWAPNTGMKAPRLNLARSAPGRSPFIVPPASAKSSFFANPVSRQLWRTASERLRESDEVAVVGYSVPATDVVASAMLGEAHRASGFQFRVVNPDHRTVVNHLTVGADVDAQHVHVVAETCEQYVDSLEREQAEAAIASLRKSVGSSTPLHIWCGGGEQRRVVELRASATGVVLIPGLPAAVADAEDGPPCVTVGELLALLDRSAATVLAATTGRGRTMVVGQMAAPLTSPEGERPVLLIPSVAQEIVA